MADNKKRHAVIPIFIPHKGCPHDCIFCNQKKISGSTKDITSQEVYEIIEESLKTINSETFTEIGFYGGSFTGIETQKQLELLEVAAYFVRQGKVSKVRLSTRPDYINEDILKYLKKHQVGTIELGVQSLDEDVLKASSRGHSVQDVYNSAQLIKEYGFGLGIQTMTGLPKDTKEKDIETAKKVIELSPSIVRIYPALVIRDTFMEKLFLRGEYHPPTLDESVDICSQLLKMYNKAGINVIRIGLQTNESIKSNSDVVAGPFHPAFRQLVESRLALDTIESEFSKEVNTDLMHHADEYFVKVFVNHRRVSNYIGQNRSNVKYLKGKYHFKDLKIIGNTHQKDDWINISFSRNID